MAELIPFWTTLAKEVKEGDGSLLLTAPAPVEQGDLLHLPLVGEWVLVQSVPKMGAIPGAGGIVAQNVHVVRGLGLVGGLTHPAGSWVGRLPRSYAPNAVLYELSTMEGWPSTELVDRARAAAKTNVFALEGSLSRADLSWMLEVLSRYGTSVKAFLCGTAARAAVERVVGKNIRGNVLTHAFGTARLIERSSLPEDEIVMLDTVHTPEENEQAFGVARGVR